MTARMQQFQKIATTDLPAMCADLELAGPVREALRRHVRDLQDWMSGILEWHRRCARYTEAELLRTYGPALSLPTGPALPGTVVASLAAGAADAFGQLRYR
jgi:germacradienol/geosmin synthase